VAGGPLDCGFCNITALLGHRPRIKTAAQIIAELDSLYALGWRGSVFFVDDNLIGNKRQLKHEILPALIEWRQGKRGLRFSTDCTRSTRPSFTMSGSPPFCASIDRPSSAYIWIHSIC
jgi:radical SAM superfamily enzyme YgiQ (UPF0313 family)